VGNLTREDFERGIGELVQVKSVPIPELGGEAFVRMLRADSRDAFDRGLFDEEGNRTQENLGARLVCLCLCDEDGVLLYNEATPGATASLLGAWPTPIIERLFQAARNFNLMEKGAVEDAAKNSETTPDDCLNSD
jgi:hypothetical protein